MKMIQLLAAATVLMVSSTAMAQTAKQSEARSKALARAEQTAAVAGCRADWLRGGNTGSNTRQFFGFMAECLSKSASR